MKFDFFNGNKNKTEEAVADEMNTTEVRLAEEEEDAVAKQDEKKKYMYIALDEDGNVILRKSGKGYEPFFCTVEEGCKPEWDERINDYANQVFISQELRVEINAVPSGLSREERKRAKQEEKNKAKEKLTRLAADKIDAAKKKLEKPVEEPKAQNEESKVQNEEPSVPETYISQSVVEEERKETPDSADKSEMEPIAESGYSSADRSTVCNDTYVIEAIKKVGDQVSRDLVDSVEDLIEIINKNDEENISSITSRLDIQTDRINDAARKFADESVNIVVKKSQAYVENIIGHMNETNRGISDAQDRIATKVTGVSKHLGELKESIESIECDLRRLKQLDTITELLKNKGLTMSMEIPPINADEADIINLVRYSQKITEQLGYAARDLIRKQEAFKSQAKNNANEQKVMDQKIAKAYDDGIIEGKMQFVKELLSKYDDVDVLRDSDNSYIHAIWTFLKELGVSIDGEGYYEAGKIIDLSAEDIERMIATYSKLDGAGKYRVVRTGLCFHGEILCKALFERVNEDEHRAVNDNGKMEEVENKDIEQEAASEEINYEGR